MYTSSLPLQPLVHSFLSAFHSTNSWGGGGGLLPYMDYTGICRSTGYGFCLSESGTGSTNQHFCLEQGICTFCHSDSGARSG